MSGDNSRLYRSRENRMILGVCGGLGEYFNVDPTLPRAAFAVLGVLSLGTWLLIYIVLAFVIPEEPEGYVDTTASMQEREEAEVEAGPAEEGPGEESS